MEIVHDEPRRVMAVEINVPVPFPVRVGSGRTWETLTERLKLKSVFYKYNQVPWGLSQAFAQPKA